MKLNYLLILLLLMVLPACGGATATESPASVETKTVNEQAAQEPAESDAAEESDEKETTMDEPATQAGETKDQSGETESQFADEDMMTTASGLQYVIVEEGTGEMPKTGNLVQVHYTGTLEDGTKFDSSYDRGEPIQFALGLEQVIPGWDEGIGLLKVGGKAKLIIPSELGYGERGAGGVIPPHATLLFDVELVGIAPGSPEAPTEVDEADYTVTESGLKYYDFKIGSGDSPQEGQAATAHYTGWLEDGTKFDSSLDRGRPFMFMFGVGQAVPGWEEGVTSMKVGGKRQIVIPPELAYGKEGAGGVIPPNATLIFEIELLSVAEHP